MAKTAELVPENVWSARLEIVREKSQLSTFALFVERVRRAHGEFPIPTARTWHTNRHPSLNYLRAVVLKFGVSAHWLLTGEGEPFDVGVIERYMEEPHEQLLSVTWPFWDDLWEVLKDRAHWWCFGDGGDITVHAAFDFIDAYLKSRGEEPTLARAVEVMDEHFLMMRKGSVVPVDDRAKLIAGMHSALAAAWLRINGGSQ